MSLVNYEGDSSEEEQDNDEIQSTARRLHLPTPAHPPSNRIIDDDDDEYPVETNVSSSSSSNLLANLPKPQGVSTANTNINLTEFPESELEDIVRGENKEYTKNIPQLAQPIKRKRDGPVKIFIPTIEQDSDEEDKPKRKQTTINRNCPLLNTLPPPMYDEDKPTVPVPIIKAPSANTPQISSTGLFLPYTISKKQQQKKSTITSQVKNDSDIEDDDDDDNQTDFLGLTKSNKIEVTNTDVESVLRETFPKARPVVIEEPLLPIRPVDFEDIDNDEQINNQSMKEDDDEELLRYLPKTERYKEIKSVHIDSMFGESGRLQLLKNATDERETMLKQAAIVVPKGETKRRAQITYLVAKAQSDELRLKNMWSEQKLTKRQTQAKYGF